VSEPTRTWPIRLTAAAESDFRHIVQWSARQFGAAQARIYAHTLTLVIEALTQGPDVAGGRCRDDIGKGLRVLHVAPHGRKGRHFLIFRVRSTDKLEAIEVLRILHDAMELTRHLPSTNA
jgi:toxin ParE1/3/4